MLPESGLQTIGQGTAESVGYSPDGQRLAIASSTGLQLFDAATLRSIGEFETDESVEALTWSPDGLEIAILAGHRIQVIDTESLEQDRVLPSDTSRTPDGQLAWSPDGEYIAATMLGMNHAHAYVWEASTARRVAVLRDQVRFPYAERLVWSPTGDRLAIGFRNGQVGRTDKRDAVVIWNAGQWAVRASRLPVPDHQAAVFFWPPGGDDLILRGASEGLLRLRIVDQQAQELLQGSEIEAFDVSPDGRRVVAQHGEERASVLALNGRSKPIWLETSARFHGLTWSRDGATLVGLAQWGESLRFWDASSGSKIADLDLESRPVDGLAWSSDGQRLAAGTRDGMIRIYTAGSSRPVALWDNAGESGINRIAWSHHNNLIASTSSCGRLDPRGCALEIVAPSNAARSIAEIDSGTYDPTFAWSPVAPWLAAETDAGLGVWEVHEDGEIDVIASPLGTPSFGLTWSPDGRAIAYAELPRSGLGQGQTSPSLVIRRAIDLGEVRRRPIDGASATYGLAWSPDGMWIAASSSYRSRGFRSSPSAARLDIWSAEDLSHVRSLGSTNGASEALAWSPDGRWLASSRGQGRFGPVLYPMAVDAPLIVLKGQTEWVEALAWSPDGSHLASGGRDGVIRTWNIESVERVLQR